MNSKCQDYCETTRTFGELYFHKIQEKSGIKNHCKLQKHPKENPEIKVNEPVPITYKVPIAIHHHHRIKRCKPKSRRKVICNFGPVAVIDADEYVLAEKENCEGFWKLVDEHPEFLILMKFGQFEHLNMPQIFESQRLSSPFQSMCIPNAEKMRARNKALHDEERDRANKRKQLIEELQRKSGQLSHYRKENVSSKYASCFARLVEEMNAFDLKCGNPVGTNVNPQRSSMTSNPNQANLRAWESFLQNEYDHSENEFSGENSIEEEGGDSKEARVVSGEIASTSVMVV